MFWVTQKLKEAQTDEVKLEKRKADATKKLEQRKEEIAQLKRVIISQERMIENLVQE